MFKSSWGWVVGGVEASGAVKLQGVTQWGHCSQLKKRCRVSHNRKATQIGDLKQDSQRASKCGFPTEAQSCSLHISCSLWETWTTFQMVAWDLESLPEPGIYHVLYHLPSSIWMHYKGFPRGSVVKNPPATARDTGSIPDPGRSHMPWSNWAPEPQLLSLCSRAREHQQEKRGQREACAPQRESSPCSLQPENEEPSQW